MQYLRNANQIQTIQNLKVGGREECYYGFVTNAWATGPNLYNPNQPCNNPNFVTWPYFPCDNPTEQTLIVSMSVNSPGYASIGCVSANRFGPPSPTGPTNRDPQMLFSPFPCETQFTQSMTVYEQVTFCALGFGSPPYNSGSALGNDNHPFGLASYIPSGSTEYTYKVIQLIPNCGYPPDTDYYGPGTPLWGPITIVSGSAYYSVSYDNPKGDGPVNPISQNMYFTPIP